MCGEKNEKRNKENQHQGSPPRVRGKGSSMNMGSIGGRITPACAGKSFFVQYHQVCKGDHPRVCGEKKSARLAELNAQGSPPRVRGKVFQFF